LPLRLRYCGVLLPPDELPLELPELPELLFFFLWCFFWVVVPD